MPSLPIASKLFDFAARVTPLRLIANNAVYDHIYALNPIKNYTYIHNIYNIYTYNTSTHPRTHNHIHISTIYAIQSSTYNIM